MIVVTFPDVPEAITQGDNEADARSMGSDALGVALLGILSSGRPLPRPSRAEPGQILLTTDADISAKIAVIEAFREAGMSTAALAERLGKDERDVRRLLDPDHATMMPELVAALNALVLSVAHGTKKTHAP